MVTGVGIMTGAPLMRGASHRQRSARLAYGPTPNASFTRPLASASRDLDRRAVADDFGHASHHLGRIVTNADDRVRPQLLRVPERQLERIGPRLLAQLGEQRDVA